MSRLLTRAFGEVDVPVKSGRPGSGARKDGSCRHASRVPVLAAAASAAALTVHAFRPAERGVCLQVTDVSLSFGVVENH